MATSAASTGEPQGFVEGTPELSLENGDRLSRAEFERRYIEGAPELVVEIVASSQSYDLHQKKDAFRRNQVREYLAWITAEQRLVWWELSEGKYQELAAGPEGLLKSGIFPGLWLDTSALLHGDMKTVLASSQRGIASPEHDAFLKA